jgi:hypothetical protein
MSGDFQTENFELTENFAISTGDLKGIKSFYDCFDGLQGSNGQGTTF